MYLLPAIDILDGHAVRLAKGDYNAVTTYNDDPVAQAQAFEQQGATWLHVVDLNGAKSGMPENAEIIEKILAKTLLKVEVGGGLRSLEALERLYQAGVTRMVLGTALVRDPEFAQAAVEKYGSALAAGIDAKAGEVAVSGWTQGSGIAATELAARMAKLGYRHLIFTDIARDGMQTGIDPRMYQEMAQAFGNPVIASGGVASVEDIENLAPVAGAIEGVITGRAIYEGTLGVTEGVAKCNEVTLAYNVAQAERDFRACGDARNSVCDSSGECSAGATASGTADFCDSECSSECDATCDDCDADRGATCSSDRGAASDRGATSSSDSAACSKEGGCNAC